MEHHLQKNYKHKGKIRKLDIENKKGGGEGMKEDILIAFKIYHLRMWRNQLYLQQYETRKGFHSCNKKYIHNVKKKGRK